MKPSVFGIAVLVTLALPITATQAQESVKLSALLGDKGGPPQPPPPSLYDNIELSKTQQDSVDAIRKRYLPLFQAINNENKSPQVRSSEFLALRVKERVDIQPQLTPDQQKIFDKNAAAVKKTDEAITKQMLSNIAAPLPPPPAP